MKKNIIILIPQLAGGGAEKVASNLSLYLPDEKYNKYIVVNDNTKNDYPFKGTLINLETKATSNLILKLINIIKRIYKLKKIKKQYNIDFTISLLSAPNIINILSRKNDKVIVSVRNFISKSSKGFYGAIFKLSIKLIYKKADSIVVVSNAIKDDLVKNFGIDKNKINVIYNPYDIEKINKLASDEIEDEYKEIFKHPTIITSGRLSNQKGQWHLIRAFKRIKMDIPEAKLVILGQGNLEGYLNQLAIDLELDKDVFFLGFKQNPFKYIAKSSVYAFPSLYEGFPNALCEAMVCGIPVISTDCKSGPREILAPNISKHFEVNEIEYSEYGLLVPVCSGIKYKYNEKLTKSEEILSQGIVELLINQEISSNYSMKSKLRAADFNKSNIIKAWEKEL